MAPARPTGWKFLARVLPPAAAASLATTMAFACPEPEHVQATLERLPESELKALYLGCARESTRQRLAPIDAALCSATAELLKERSFGGDFDAMLAWWRSQRD